MIAADAAGPGAPGDAPRDRRRILYLSKHFGFPLGGIRIAHHHVAMLVRNGFDARILLIDEKRDAHFDGAVPTDSMMPSFAIRPTDLVVIPEPWGSHIRQFSRYPVRRYVFCQNHFYAFHGLGDAAGYAEAGIDTVFCCSEVISDFLTTVMGLERAPIIHNAIDHAVFKPAAKRRQIAVMPRKMKIEARFIAGCFKRRYPELAGIPWVEIEGLPEAEVAEILGASAVFLALGRIEGFGLPPIEAMASGCLVVGFTGDGGRSFANPQNGLWCEPEDWVGCTDLLARAVREHDADGGRLRVDEGIRTASAFTLERMERELVAFWQAEIAR